MDGVKACPNIAHGAEEAANILTTSDLDGEDDIVELKFAPTRDFVPRWMNASAGRRRSEGGGLSPGQPQVAVPQTDSHGGGIASDAATALDLFGPPPSSTEAERRGAQPDLDEAFLLEGAALAGARRPRDQEGLGRAAAVPTASAVPEVGDASKQPMTAPPAAGVAGSAEPAELAESAGAAVESVDPAPDLGSGSGAQGQGGKAASKNGGKRAAKRAKARATGAGDAGGRSSTEAEAQPGKRPPAEPPVDKQQLQLWRSTKGAARWLEQAACKDDAAGVRIWLDTPEARRLQQAVLAARGSDGFTALHFACRHGAAEMAALLVGAGADAFAKDSYGKLPHHYATIYQHTAVLQALPAAPRPDNADASETSASGSSAKDASASARVASDEEDEPLYAFDMFE